MSLPPIVTPAQPDKPMVFIIVFKIKLIKKLYNGKAGIKIRSILIQTIFFMQDMKFY